MKLFRKHRLRLFKKGATSTYLRYTAGEILIVIIGVLIAIQLNNWNENRKTQAVIQNYFERIQEEIQNNVAVIEANATFTKDTIVGGLKQARLIIQHQEQDSLGVLLKKIQWLTETESLTFQFPIIEEFIANGYLSKVGDSRLNNLFVFLNYYREQCAISNEQTRDLQINLLKPFLSKNVRYASIDIYNRDEPSKRLETSKLERLLGNLEAENLISIYISHMQESTVNLDSLIDFLNKIDQQIAILNNKK